MTQNMIAAAGKSTKDEAPYPDRSVPRQAVTCETMTNPIHAATRTPMTQTDTRGTVAHAGCCGCVREDVCGCVCGDDESKERTYGNSNKGAMHRRIIPIIIPTGNPRQPQMVRALDGEDVVREVVAVERRERVEGIVDKGVQRKERNDYTVNKLFHCVNGWFRCVTGAPPGVGVLHHECASAHSAKTPSSDYSRLLYSFLPFSLPYE